MGGYEKWADVPFGGELEADSAIVLPSLSVTMRGSTLVMPYNYIPFFKAPAQDPDLGEGDSPGREEWRPGHYSGEIQLVWRAAGPPHAG